MRTHEVTNQPSPLTGLDVLGADAILTEAVGRWVLPQDSQGAAALTDLGVLAGTGEPACGRTRRTAAPRCFGPTPPSASGSTRSTTTRLTTASSRWPSATG
ncbi:MAG: hypothetical protein ABIU87_04530 [Ornithinibacter sp.]